MKVTFNIIESTEEWYLRRFFELEYRRGGQELLQYYKKSFNDLIEQTQEHAIFTRLHSDWKQKLHAVNKKLEQTQPLTLF